MKSELLHFFKANERDATSIIPGTDVRMVRARPRFGIFIPINRQLDYFKDDVNSISLSVGSITTDPGRVGVLISCHDAALKEQFADECARFLRPDNLQKIKEDPLGWWNELKTLFGNVLTNDNHYFLFAEFLVYLLLHKNCGDSKNGLSVKWKSCAATHDIEMSDGSQHEVKATIKRTASIITISSQFQMSVNPNSPFFIYFLRIEPERQDGVSIQDLILKAGALNCDMHQIDTILTAQGLTPGSPKRHTRFAVLEAKRFDVGTGPFPKLTPDSFRPEWANLLEAVENFSYDVNLSAVTCPRDDILDALKIFLGK